MHHVRRFRHAPQSPGHEQLENMLISHKRSMSSRAANWYLRTSYLPSFMFMGLIVLGIFLKKEKFATNLRYFWLKKKTFFYIYFLFIINTSTRTIFVIFISKKVHKLIVADRFLPLRFRNHPRCFFPSTDNKGLVRVRILAIKIFIIGIVAAAIQVTTYIIDHFW